MFHVSLFYTFTFSHLADAFIQSDLQCIHILHLHWWHTAHQELSVLLKDASTGNRTSNLLITKRLLYHCTTVAPTRYLGVFSSAAPHTERMMETGHTFLTFTEDVIILHASQTTEIPLRWNGWLASLSQNEFSSVGSSISISLDRMKSYFLCSSCVLHRCRQCTMGKALWLF